MAELAPGTVFAGFRIDRVAGRGGMGVVYRATQLGLGRPVALKLIAEERAAAPAFRARFQRESRLTAAIDHPNVIPVYAAGEESGHLYLAMRYVAGTDLEALLRRAGPLPPARAPARRGGPRRSPRRSPWGSTRPPALASSTATSSRRTSCSRATTCTS